MGELVDPVRHQGIAETGGCTSCERSDPGGEGAETALTRTAPSAPDGGTLGREAPRKPHRPDGVVAASSPVMAPFKDEPSEMPARTCWQHAGDVPGAALACQAYGPDPSPHLADRCSSIIYLMRTPNAGSGRIRRGVLVRRWYRYVGGAGASVVPDRPYDPGWVGTCGARDPRPGEGGSSPLPARTTRTRCSPIPHAGPRSRARDRGGRSGLTGVRLRAGGFGQEANPPGPHGSHRRRAVRPAGAGCSAVHPHPEASGPDVDPE